MKNLSITALVLFSTSAFATDARKEAHQNNLGIKDDVDYRTFYSKTDNGKDSMWFDLKAGQAADGAAAGPAGNLSASYKADGRSMALDHATTGGTTIHYYSASGDTGFGVGLDIVNKDTITVNGGYGMTNGKTDMAFGGEIAKGADSTNISAGVISRTLNKDDVNAWAASLGYLDKAIKLDGTYQYGWRFTTDRSAAGVHFGPRAQVTKPEEGDMDIQLTLAEINVGGEFALNDWFGLRGSVVSALEAIVPMGEKEFDVMTRPISPMFGASLDFEGADIDFTIDPAKVLDGPFFLTGANTTGSFAAQMSARFDI